MKIPRILFTLSLGLIVSSCASFKIEQVDFGWPVEGVLTVSNMNTVEEVRYAVSFIVTNLALEEFQDSTALRGTQLRLLRNTEGFYFITGPRFKHVYVMKQNASELAMKSKIDLNERVLKNPALNQRTPHIELVDDDGFKVLLTSDDIDEGSKK